MSSESPKAASIPSVARTRTSPGCISSVVVLTLGNSCPATPLLSASEPFGRVADGSPLSTLPSTLPTPSQVIAPLRGEMKARLIAAPRVSRSALWQRSASRTRSWLARSRTISPAFSAAWAASPPCPTPSIAATRAPSGSSVSTARSPVVASPRRHLIATAHSSGSRGVRSATPPSLLAQPCELVAEPPFLHRHGRAVGARRDLELVHEAPGSGQAEAEAAPPAVVVAERRLYVANPRALVAGDYDKAVAVGLLERPEDDLATADMNHHVPRHLRDRGCDQGGVRARKAEPLGHGPRFSSRGHQIRVGLDGDADLILHPLRPPGSSDRAALPPRLGRGPRAAAPGSGGTAPSRSPHPAGCRLSRCERPAASRLGRWLAGIGPRRSR